MSPIERQEADALSILTWTTGIAQARDEAELADFVAGSLKRVLETPFNAVLLRPATGDSLIVSSSQEHQTLNPDELHDVLRALLRWSEKSRPGQLSVPRSALALNDKVSDALRSLSADELCLTPIQTISKALGFLVVGAPSGSLDPDRTVLVLSAIAAQAAVAIERSHAFEEIQEKKARLEETLARLQQSEHEKKSLEVTVDTLQAEVRDRSSFGSIVGRSPAMSKVLEMATDVAETNATVLLLGASGTGKELMARAIHYNSPRKRGPFVALNCAAAPEHLLESELFGHEKGAFTGADRAKPGKFELAQRGTFFLDEIGDMNVGLQAKLLRVLQEREFERVGGTKPIKADARIICATNKELEKAVSAGQFREDLYYRINAFPIRLPPLRERREDILPLAEHFLQRLCQETGKKVPGISKEAQEFLLEHSWQGNVRELQNAIERAVILSHGELIQSQHLGLTPEPTTETGASPAKLPADGVSLEELERDLIAQALERTKGNKSEAARLLGLSRSALRYRLSQIHPK